MSVAAHLLYNFVENGTHSKPFHPAGMDQKNE
jgi:hypothetical protein